MINKIIKKLNKLCLGTALMQLIPASAYASGGPKLEFNEPLEKLLKNLTGPTAQTISTLGIVIGGVLFIFAGYGAMMRTLSGVIISAAIITKAAALLSSLGITGAAC